MVNGLRIIMNDRPLRQTLTGVGHYVRELLLHLPAVAPQCTVDPFFFKFLSRRDWRTAAGDAPPASAAVSVSQLLDESSQNESAARQRRDLSASRKPWWLRRIMQDAYGAAFRLLARNYAIYHEPNHIPIRSALPTVTTIHDLSVIAHPEWHPADRVRWYEREFAAGARLTRRFIAASEYTKRQMVERMGVPAERIDVTYQAPRAAFQPAARETQIAFLRERRLADRFFLYVGTLEPRKNLPGLLRAFAALPAETRRRHPLVIVGAWGWKQEQLREHLANRDIAHSVFLLGYLCDEDLAVLYSACTALVWPTFYEGFGMPPLEAMACGAPVIVSRETSLPEVVGAAGILLDPLDEATWTQAMRRAADDEEWRADASRRSRARAATFSWTRCAEQTVRCYETALAM